MKFTDLNYYLDDNIVKKLNIMIERCVNKKVRKDALLLIEGSEGEGKTNTSEAVAYYVKSKTKRNIHMFFKLQNLIDFAKTTNNKIIIWDEPAIDSLSIDWYNQVNKDLLRLLMTCRKKRHFIIINMVKFYKFSEYVVVDRALGIIHMYSRKEVEPGRFVYIRKKNLEHLFNDYKQKKIRNYKKRNSFHGTFPNVEPLMDQMGITIEDEKNCNIETYEKLKDRAINTIGKRKDKTDKNYLMLQNLKLKVGSVKMPLKTLGEFSKQLGIHRTSLHDWSKIKIDKEDETKISEPKLKNVV